MRSDKNSSPLLDGDRDDSAVGLRRSNWKPQFRVVPSFYRLAAIVTTVGLVACASNIEQKTRESMPPVDYTSQIEPILNAYCYQCHGPLQVPSGKLHLDSRKGALKGGRSGRPAIVPGSGATSPIVIAVSGGDDEMWRVMPPRGKGLRSREIELIRRWIDEGATFDER